MKSVFLFSLFLAFQARAALFYAPENLDPAKAKIVVVIHGCLQSAEAMAAGTGFNHLADQNNLIIVYPQVPAGSHSLNCWGWFAPENQKRESGQLKLIFDQLVALRNKMNLKNVPAFVVGMSSGAVTAAGMLACFPQEFAGGAIHSGAAYGLVADEKSAQILLDQGPEILSEPLQRPCNPKDFSGKLMVIQGALDQVVNPKHATFAIKDFLGAVSGSIEKKGYENGATYTITQFSERAQLVMVDQLPHAWSGANLSSDLIRLPFFANVGPNATKLMVEFLTQ